MSHSRTADANDFPVLALIALNISHLDDIGGAERLLKMIPLWRAALGFFRILSTVFADVISCDIIFVILKASFIGLVVHNGSLSILYEWHD